MALKYIYFSLYRNLLGTTSLVWSPTPCMGTSMALNTGNQKSGRHYLSWRMCWTAPISSQIKRSMGLNSPVHSVHSSITPWWIHFVSIIFFLFILPESQRSQLCCTERNHCLSLFWLVRILYDRRNSNSSAASVAMNLKLYLVPQLSIFFMIWSYRNSTTHHQESTHISWKKVSGPNPICWSILWLWYTVRRVQS